MLRVIPSFLGEEGQHYFIEDVPGCFELQPSPELKDLFEKITKYVWDYLNTVYEYPNVKMISIKPVEGERLGCAPSPNEGSTFTGPTSGPGCIDLYFAEDSPCTPWYGW